jgi:hypothetical protein
MAGKTTRIMYIQQKTGDNAGEARIGRVRFSRTGRTLYYGDKVFIAVGGRGIYGNYYGYDRAAYEAHVNAKLSESGPIPHRRGRKSWSAAANVSVKLTESGPIPGFLGEFWISGPKKNGQYRHPCEWCGPVQVDEDAADEYWKEIRGIERSPGTAAGA